MATVVLVRHGRTTANTAGVLAGRSAGVHLDDRGREQAAAAAARLAPVTLAAVVSSPLTRCKETAAEIARGRDLRVRTDSGLTECDYGDWTGRSLRDLAKEKLWRTVQTQPSAAVFPGGESLGDVQQRAVAAVRRRDREVEEEHGAGAVWVAVSHGDVIKALIADALGMHLDLFQRLHVDPASISVVRYTAERPFVLGTNTHAGDLAWLTPPARRGRRRAASTDAVVGGGAGPSSSR